MPDVSSDTASALPASPRRTAAARIVRFAAVGTTGFGIDAALTIGFIRLGLDAFLARALAISVAMGATYILNRRFTFGDTADADPAGIAGEATRYVAVAVGSAMLNWLVYSAALLSVPGLPPFAAIVIGSGVAMAASYLGYSRYAFRGGAR
ncbi:MAG: GtrA family protein [Ancalomicrobiaceae bacterium]|nr:GtrA family protein [Ancalomicrobiaceae bacterium]